jgi:hypothetical protein
MSPGSDDIHFKEWERTRKLLLEFDNRIHDIRKYGFSFLTALMAAEAILIPKNDYMAVGEVGLTDTTKLAVFGVTLLLIGIIKLMEKYYQLFITCSAQRARILERSLNLELTEIISDRHRSELIPKYVNNIYFFFILGVFVLGYAVLIPNLREVLLLILITVLALFSIRKIDELSLEYTRERMDWTINPLECKPGEKVRITLTNISKDNKKGPLILEPGLVWGIETQDRTRGIHRERLEKIIKLNAGDNYIWEWTPKKKQFGIFRVVIPYKEKGKEISYPRLRRKIIVREDKSKDKNKDKKVILGGELNIQCNKKKTTSDPNK